MEHLKKPLFKLLISMKTPDGISYLDNMIYDLHEKGLSFNEIGKLLEIGSGTIRTRYGRTERRKL